MDSQSYISKDDLQGLNIQLDDTALVQVLEELNDKVAALVGEEIVSSLTPNDTEKLADMMDDATEEEMAQWIISKVPDYPEIIQNNIDIVIGDYIESQESDQK